MCANAGWMTDNGLVDADTVCVDGRVWLGDADTYRRTKLDSSAISL